MTAASLWTTEGIIVLEQVGGAYREAAVLTAADALRTDDPFPLVLPVADIF